MDTQSKYRIVADVISLCDENDRLREQVRTIEAAEREQRDVTATASLSVTDAYFIEAGKRAAVNKAINSWDSGVFGVLRVYVNRRTVEVRFNLDDVARCLGMSVDEANEAAGNENVSTMPVPALTEDDFARFCAELEE